MLSPLAAGLAIVVVLCTACSHPSTDPRSNDTPAVSAADRSAIRGWLAGHRARQIERLEAYARAGEFPHNYVQPTASHIFRDDAGRLCAVANLVHQDGRDDLVDATAREHNDLAIADVRTGAMLEWVLASGLTQDELARIQAPATPLARRISPTPRPTRVAPSADLVAKNAADDELRMKAAVREHVATVARELRANVGDEPCDRDRAVRRAAGSTRSAAGDARGELTFLAGPVGLAPEYLWIFSANLRRLPWPEMRKSRPRLYSFVTYRARHGNLRLARVGAATRVGIGLGRMRELQVVW